MHKYMPEENVVALHMEQLYVVIYRKCTSMQLRHKQLSSLRFYPTQLITLDKFRNENYK